jgi:signal transduction histidine kinase
VSPSSLKAALLLEHHGLAVLYLEGGSIVRMNQPARTLLGPEATPGVELVSLVEPECVSKLERALASSSPAVCECQIRRRGREPHAVELLSVPIEGGHILVVTSGSPRYSDEMAASLLDASTRLANVTREVSRRASELEAANASLEGLLPLRDQFVATLSHDVRSPLTAVRLQAAELERNAGSLPPEEVARRAATIRRASGRLLEMMSRVLDAAQLKAGRVLLEVEPVTMRSVASEVIDALGALAHGRAVRLEIDPASSPGEVSGDRVRLFQVLSNLAQSAIRHAPPGSAVTFRIRDDGARVRCGVADEGPGVAPDRRDAIFEPFRKEGAHAGSAGLGLHIVRQLVTLHGGSVWAEANEPRGATFVVELPRRTT